MGDADRVSRALWGCDAPAWWDPFTNPAADRSVWHRATSLPALRSEFRVRFRELSPTPDAARTGDHARACLQALNDQEPYPPNTKSITPRIRRLVEAAVARDDYTQAVALLFQVSAQAIRARYGDLDHRAYEVAMRPKVGKLRFADVVGQRNGPP